MSEGNGNGARGDGLLDRLAELAEDFPQAIADLEAEREEIDAQIKRLRVLRRALDPSAPSARPAAKPAQKAPKQVAPNKLKAIGEAIRRIDAETFTAQAVMGQLQADGRPSSDGTVYHALRRLREMECIGRAGVEPRDPENPSPRPRDRYWVLDAEALAALGA